MSLSKAMQELEEQHDLIRQKLFDYDVALRSAFNDKSRLTAELAAANRDAEMLRETSQAISDHITDHPTRDFDIPDEIYIPWIDAIRGRPVTAAIAEQEPK